MEQQHSKAYVNTIRLWQKLQDVGIQIKNPQPKFTQLTYDEDELNTYDLFLKADYAYVDCSVFIGLSKRATVMIAKIMSELKYNNPLWLFNHRVNARDSSVVTELRKRNILLRTGTTSIHYVNPFFIRKGKIGNVLSLTAKLLEKCKKVNADHIKRLQRTKKSRISGYDYIGIT
jgi:hypothetical protein